MASLNGTFDATAVEPSAPRDLIPPGKYLAQIVRSEMKENKAGTGQYLEIELDILDGECAGRKLWDRMNIIHPNAQAAEIAQRTLSAICHAIGKLQVSDSEELHAKPMLVTVKVRPAREQFQASNEIGGYAPAPGRPTPTAAFPRPAAVAPAPAAPAAKPAFPPWARRTA